MRARNILMIKISWKFCPEVKLEAPKPTQNPEIPPKNTAFTRTFSKSSRELFPAFLWHESGTQRKLFRKTRSEKLNTNFFFSNFSGAAGISWQKSRDIPPKMFDFPGFEGHTELFGPHPFTWKTPTPPENIRTNKFGFGFFFFPESSKFLESLFFNAEVKSIFWGYFEP